MPEGFSQWCHVELFGHQEMVGLVSEQQIGGDVFLRLDVPASGSREAFTKFYGRNAIYSLTPITEEFARAMIEQRKFRPIVPVALSLPKPDWDEESGEDDFPT